MGVAELYFVNDTANAKMTTGVTINQGAADDEIVALKSSDVAHGMTDVAETDTYGVAKKNVADEGGLRIHGFTETKRALLLQGYYTTDETGGRSTGSDAPVMLDAQKRDGTGTTTPGADANIAAIASGGLTKFVFDAEGDSHEDGTGWTAYDEHDDVALLEAVNTAMILAGRRNDPIRAEFWAWAREHARRLQELRLVTFNPDGHHFVNRSKMQELLVGAVRQLGRQLAETRGRLEIAERRLAVPPPGIEMKP